jgi:hypothetical protein
VNRRSAIERRLDGRVGLVGGDELLRRRPRRLQPLRVDVHQRERAPGQLRHGEHVADQVAGEDGRPGSDERDPRHGG